MPTAVVTIKRLYKGFASIRTTTIDICIKKGADLKIKYNNQTMTVPLEKLKSPHKFQIHSRVFTSKFNPNQRYTLYDFPFVVSGIRPSIEIKYEKEQLENIYKELKNKFDELLKGFTPIFGNIYHIDTIPLIEKTNKSLKKLKKYKAGLTRAKTLALSIKRDIRNIEFLINKL